MIIALRDGTLDIEKAKEAQYLNDNLPSMIGGK
jgi:hypothetical protein